MTEWIAAVMEMLGTVLGAAILAAVGWVIRSLRDIRDLHSSHADVVDKRLDKVEQQIVRIDELDRHKVLDRVGMLETQMAAAVKSGDLDRLHDRISGVRRESADLHGEVSGLAGEVRAMHQSVTTIVQHLLERPEGARK